MTQCPSTAQLIPGGAIVRCERELGHDRVQRIDAVKPTDPTIYSMPTPHACTLTWDNPAGIEVDPELYDPAETFDLEVGIEPAVVLRRELIESGVCMVDGCAYLVGHRGPHTWE